MKDKNIYHEIKNQISVCDLYTEIVRRTLEKEGIENETLTRSIKNIKNSLSLIADCASSLREVRLQELSLANLIGEAVEICKAYKDITFVNDIPTSTTITADKNKFTSALVNIMKNAIEAGATEIKISGNASKISIENNGTLIPPEIREKIFTDGFTTKENGSGFGLMLTQKTLKEQGFDLSLAPAKNVTIFNILRK